MKVVFLDIDGVLNSLTSCREFGTYKRLDPRAVANLNKITASTGARIVVSSSWRRLYNHDGEECATAALSLVLARQNVAGRVIGATPTLDSGPIPLGVIVRSVERRHEIRAWLDRHPEVTAWVAIDDDSDAGPDNFVQTLFEVGLTEADADKAICILEPSTIVREARC